MERIKTMDSKTIITITGPSGSGKDMIARMLSEATGVEILSSYTTRPMRKGEIDGREHIFVNIRQVALENTLAYTHFGGHEYWTTPDQIKKIAIYVIDERGLIDMQIKFPWIKFIKIHVTSAIPLRILRGVSISRILRDRSRLQLPAYFYNFNLTNNSTKKYIRNHLNEVVKTIKRTVTL